MANAESVEFIHLGRIRKLAFRICHKMLQSGPPQHGDHLVSRRCHQQHHTPLFFQVATLFPTSGELVLFEAWCPSKWMW